MKVFLVFLGAILLATGFAQTASEEAVIRGLSDALRKTHRPMPKK